MNTILIFKFYISGMKFFSPIMKDIQKINKEMSKQEDERKMLTSGCLNAFRLRVGFRKLTKRCQKLPKISSISGNGIEYLEGTPLPKKLDHIQLFPKILVVVCARSGQILRSDWLLGFGVT